MSNPTVRTTNARIARWYDDQYSVAVLLCQPSLDVCKVDMRSLEACRPKRSVAADLEERKKVVGVVGTQESSRGGCTVNAHNDV